ncbi:Cytochrome P450, E-class, group I,Cytochrome P450,Cytochrome P450, conserved site [Cinara cedri]|uniref:Cytochrome P450, E-class, group I,Cytochrome P450,Cytochrome P450, conserved site n=1 Tax=Cinara cedri TaxID=506608 RepID=A0A5E4NG48_9HEMI|nr:Cytochrome P450, E-class, group I,Cytochrome P450,Cytochrome P450, conserved site [Cinara cedri]
MYNQIKDCSDLFINNLRETLTETNEIDFKTACSKYFADVLGTCFYGLQMNIIEDETSAFHKYGKKLIDANIASNAFIMFTGGLETLSSSMSFRLYELSLKKHIQDKARNEIRCKLSQHGGSITNDFLSELSYLGMIINEYYSDPEVFDPKRFSPKKKINGLNGTYIPFGNGPRMCFAKRFVSVTLKIVLIEVLSKYEVEPNERIQIPITFDKGSLVVLPESEVQLRLKLMMITR